MSEAPPLDNRRLFAGAAIATGLLSFLPIVLAQTSVLALVQIGALGIWGIAAGIMLLRVRPDRPLRT